MIRRPSSLLPVGALLAVLFAAAPAVAQHAFVWEAPDQAAVRDLLEIETFYTNFINTGTTTDSFRVLMTVEAPANWVISMCEGSFCYAPFIREFDFELAPGDTNKLGTNITAVTDLGRAVATVTVTNLDAPQQTATRSFALLTPGFDALVVAADPSFDPSPWVVAALGAASKTAVTWPRSGDGKLTAADYAHYETVIWAAGTAPGTLGPGDREALADYAQHGGHVWLHGADLVFGLCSPGSPAYSPASLAWCHDVAGVNLVAAATGSFTVNGVAGDELGNGLTLGLNGGDSANNNNAADGIAAVGGGVACLRYGIGTVAGVRRVWGAGRIVTTGFTLEGVATAAMRGELTAAVLDWYVNGIAAADDTPAAALIGTPHAVPNPFNPRTVITYEVGGAVAQAVVVTIHDLRGRVVRRLFDDSVAPGTRSQSWDGRDAEGRMLAAGVYIARVQAGADHASVKLTLAK
jgi:hypothetical protein